MTDAFLLFCRLLLTSGSEANISTVLGMLDPERSSSPQDLVQTMRRAGVKDLDRETLVRKKGKLISLGSGEADTDEKRPSLGVKYL